MPTSTNYDPCVGFYQYGYRGGYTAHTGDPHLDMEYERDRDYKGAYIVPEVIKSFLSSFRDAVADQNLYEIQDLYDNRYTYRARFQTSYMSCHIYMCIFYMWRQLRHS